MFNNLQVLGKACKPIPVMLLGVLLAGKKYNTVKYLCILMITMGVALFMYKDKKAEGSSSVSMGAGELLVVSIYLLQLFGYYI